MPNKASARKELRKIKKRVLANNKVKRAYREAVKSVKKSLDAGEKITADVMKLTQKKLDKAAKKGVIKKRTAARRLSRLMKRTHKSS